MKLLTVDALLLITLLSKASFAAPGGNSACAQWCALNFPQPGPCTSAAAHGEGACYTCGPKKTNQAEALCNGVCTDTSSDNANCGSCGNACSSAQTCTSGVCVGSLTCMCPPTDNDGFPLVQHGQENGFLFCSYPVFPKEDPHDFYCYYDNNTGNLAEDHDVGLCPSHAVCT